MISFNDDDRVQITLTVVMGPASEGGIDPDDPDLLVALKVDGTEYDCTILTTTPGDTTWTGTARTDGFFCGPQAVADGATVLAYGTHNPEIVVSNGTVTKSHQLSSFTIRR